MDVIGDRVHLHRSRVERARVQRVGVLDVERDELRHGRLAVRRDVLPLSAAFGAAGDALADAVRTEDDEPFAVMEEFLRARLHDGRVLDHRAHDRRADRRGPRRRLARTALDLGYFDQAHCIRDFKALVGASPAQYAAA